ncbi:MAG TPA: hypothetical protein PKV13_02310 [Propionicimonas sp.]|nr:hypothetical protein [Propionicimonas sp.]HRA05435.1 hypothetical protein [Propionicimonas sp.]
MVLLDLGSSLVTPSWLPLVMVIVLLGLVAFLYFNMRKNLNRIDIKDDPAVASPSSPEEKS